MDETKQELAWALQTWGDLYKDHDKLDDAEEMYARALAALEHAAGAFDCGVEECLLESRVPSGWSFSMRLHR
jgi:hypothetical protein